MNAKTGGCLCGDVRFEVRGRIPDLYQCHCSLCRKMTGSSANAGLAVRAGDFSWAGRARKVRSFERPTGFRNDFCARCGSPVPFAVEGEDQVWIPAGAFDGPIGARVAHHIHVASKADWDEIGGAGIRHATDPGPAVLFGRQERAGPPARQSRRPKPRARKGRATRRR